ncbi:MAG: YgjV family protein [Defluviitaleaceae bacterium]|nr:YgjV family protein [Defluviitaleaceae bacterium]
MIDFFVNAFERITRGYYHFDTAINEYVFIPPELSSPIWIVSQIFAFIALVFMVWSFQCKKKLKVMLLLGFGTFFLAVSASFLGNWTLAALFAQASVRNYVFWFFDWRVDRGIHVPRKYYNVAAVIFSTLIVATTIYLVHILQVPTSGVVIEWFIAATLVGLTIGNVLKGQNVMRLSFVVNRMFNIVNHVYFLNAIAVIIAAMAIGSNGVYYIRLLVSWLKNRNKEQAAE